jgi:hypothetical protein
MKKPELPASGWDTHVEQTGPDAGRFWNILTTLNSGLAVRTLRTDAAPPAIRAAFAAGGQTLPKFLLGVTSAEGHVLDTLGFDTAAEAYACHFDTVHLTLRTFPFGTLKKVHS